MLTVFLKITDIISFPGEITDIGASESLIQKKKKKKKKKGIWPVIQKVKKTPFLSQTGSNKASCFIPVFVLSVPND